LEFPGPHLNQEKYIRTDHPFGVHSWLRQRQGQKAG
jgi:hypothetical protein